MVWGRVQEDWFGAVNHLSRVTPWLHTPARMYAELGVGAFAGLLLLSWWLARGDGDLRRAAAALWAPIAVLAALGVNQFLVAAFAEPRPYTVLPDTLVLVSRSADYSFPSDHAVMAGAVAAGVWVAHRRLGLITAALAVLMAFTWPPGCSSGRESRWRRTFSSDRWPRAWWSSWGGPACGSC